MSWSKKIVKSLKWTIPEMALGGLLLVIPLIFFKFDFQFTFMTGRLDYLFFIVNAILLPLPKALLINLIDDTLLLLLRGTIGLWSWSFALVPLIISLLVCMVKWIFTKIHNKSLFAYLIGFNIFIFIASLSVVLVEQYVYVVKNKFENYSIIIIVTIFSICNFLITLMLFFKQTKHLKYFIISWNVVSITLSMTLWLYQPFNLIYYLGYLQGNGISFKDNYFIFLFPRMMKSLVEIPIFALLVTSVVKMKEILDSKLGNNTRWI